jgi:hypothetical protein
MGGFGLSTMKDMVSMLLGHRYCLNRGFRLSTKEDRVSVRLGEQVCSEQGA